MTTLDLSRTKMALERYDKLNGEYEPEGLSNKEASKLLGQLERAKKAVGEAFALDTQDRNNADTARMAQPGPWLRQLVDKYGETT